jgi:adenylate cyclase
MGNRRIVLVYGIASAIVAAVLAIYRPGFLSQLDRTSYDMVMRSAGTRQPSGRVVIVDVDERSLAAVGQWPWRRDKVAQLVEAIRARGAAVVALDIIFSEPDGSDPTGASDAAFADTLRGGGAILGYGMTFDDGIPSAGNCALHALNLPITQAEEAADDDATPLFHASRAICSLPGLGAAAGASGFLNAAPDSDGILRRAPLLMDLDGQVYPSLALMATAMVSGAGDASLQVANVNASTLRFGGASVPLDAKSNLLVRYRGEKGTFPFISAADVVSGAAGADLFKDRIVLVGTTALGTREVVATPLDTLFTGVEVQATIADNLLQRDFIWRPQSGALLESLLALALAAAIAVITSRTRMLWGGLATVAGIAWLWLGAAWLFRHHGLFISPLFPTAGVATGYVIMSLAKSTLEGRRADTAGAEKVTAQRLMVQALLSLTETRDAETGRHSRRTQQYAKLLAESLSQHPGYRDYLTAERIDLFSSLAPLHDIGKVGVPDHILNKPTALTSEELVEMRKHPVHGRDVILKAEQQVGVRDDAILAMAKDIVYTHHERWDGSGYPQGLCGAAIPIEGRVMAIVDMYDAAVARNVYRSPITHDAAVKYIMSAKGTHFDPAVVDAFVRVAADFQAISGQA